ncbi:MAG: hypothetical protein MJB12_11775, partial [Firmicutes bacterium]|nr:hypothetical protein [Bacillota bacterium]
IFIFFGKIISDPNNYYFTTEGDGFKAYYGAIYHMQHDTGMTHLEGMNYPFGEMVFFTGSQPFIVNSLKLVSNHFVDLSDHVVGIINMIMILAILAAAIILYLIFSELGLSWRYSSIVAVGICMLSPQIARMGGHFSLSYLFWIPWMIYLLIRYDKKPSWKISLQMALVTFLAAGTHLYFVGFYGFMIGFYWFNYVWKKRNMLKAYFNGFVSFLVQFVLPVVIIQLIISMNDSVVDRTALPYGFFVYKAHPVGILLPSAFPYDFVPRYITVFRHIQWESLAFVGVAGLSAFLYGLFNFIKKAVGFNVFWKVSDSSILNQLFWASFAALLFSFGIPFILGLEGLADWLGPIRQLRALARFSWVFFYMLNIVLFYWLYKKVLVEKAKPKWIVITVLAVSFLLFDDFCNISNGISRLANRNLMLEDKSNLTKINEWAKSINPDDFQAIFPLPYFHVGSENIWIDSKNGTAELTMNLSLKTGLPTNGVILSRTSIEQTYLNYHLTTEPLNYSNVLDQLPNDKPFLLLINKSAYLNEDEQRIANAATLLYENEKFILERLEVQDIKALPDLYKHEVFTKLTQNEFVKSGECWVSNSNLYVDFSNYEKIEKIPYKAWVTLYDKSLDGVKSGRKFYVSFWVEDYMRDGRMRANIELIQKNKIDNSTTNYFYSDIHRHIKAFDGNKALVEFTFETKTNDEKIILSIRNKVLKNDDTIIHGLLIREEGQFLLTEKSDQYFINSRILPKSIAKKIRF